MRGRVLAATLVASTVSLGSATHAFAAKQYAYYPNGAPLIYESNGDNVMTSYQRIVVAYWGWPGGGHSDYLEAWANATAAGAWRTSNVLTQYSKKLASNSTPESITLASVPVVIQAITPGPSNPPSQQQELAAVDAVLAQYPAASTLVVLAYPQGASDLCSGGAGCHDWSRTYLKPYLVLPYTAASQNYPWYAQHEFEESLTDVFLDSGGSPAWIADTNQWQVPGDLTEIGDVCEFSAAGVSPPLTARRSFQLLPRSAGTNVLSMAPAESNLGGFGGGGYCVYARSTRSDSFVLGTDGSVYQSTDANMSWKSWGAPTGATLASAPAAVSHDPEHIDVFARATSGDLWQRATANGGQSLSQWADWGRPTGYVFAGRPTIASWGANRIDIYAVGTPTGGGARALFHRSWDDYLDSGWQAVVTNCGLSCSGQNFTPGGAPGATSWGPGGVQVAILDDATVPNLWVGQSTDGQAFTWNNVGNNNDWLDPAAAPDLGSHDVNTVDVFVADIFHTLQHYWISNGTSGWDPPGNNGNPLSLPTAVKSGTGPSVVGRGDYRLLVNYTDANNSVWQREYDFGWKNWQQILYNSGTAQDSDVSAW